MGGGGKAKGAGSDAAQNSQQYSNQNIAAQKAYDAQRQTALLAALSKMGISPQFFAAGQNPGVFGAATANSVNPAAAPQPQPQPQPPKGP